MSKHLHRSVLWLAWLLACSSANTPPGVPSVTDAGRTRDSAIRGDGSTFVDGALTDADSHVDGALEDGAAAVDAHVSTDVGVTDADASAVDAAARDGSVLDAGGFEFDAGPEFDPCPALAGAATCSSDLECGVGARCLSNGCGVSVCMESGSPCTDGTDCSAGSTCELTELKYCVPGAGRCESDMDCGSGRACVPRSVCVYPESGDTTCGDFRDCPPGFACEETDTGASCVNRRISCSATRACPYGYLCVPPSVFGTASFCTRAHPTCRHDVSCIGFGRCRDIAGAGVSQCTLPGMCETNADCPDSTVCGLEPERIAAFCLSYGPCAVAGDCTPGFACRDMWGDGSKECVPTLGADCDRSSDCPEASLCAVPYGEDALECISVAR